MNDSGQLYTIEGVAAAIMMVITAYLVISSASIFTPQEKHVAQMQLEQLGHDALVVMDTPRENGMQSYLAEAIAHNRSDWFENNYTALIQSRAEGPNDTAIKYNVSIYYWNSGTIEMIPFVKEDYHRENAAKVTQWAYITDTQVGESTAVLDDKVVLVEVLLWRD